jgi:uncharacterized membrane protein YphA (DoxX/SURF4 family)
MPLRVLSLALGIFLLFMGLDKLDWFADSGFLEGRLEEWRGMARPLVRWYLETIAIPGAPVFARVVPLAELSAATALILGIWVRWAALLAMLMVINFHFAADIIFRYDYLINAYGLPILGGLAALALGGKRLPMSLLR